MSEAKFTKGDWQYQDGWSAVYTPKGDIVCEFTEANTNEHYDYNAHLIAAAPEMYYEIESDIFRLEQRMKFKDENREIMPMLEAERDRKVKLLAKARGES